MKTSEIVMIIVLGIILLLIVTGGGMYSGMMGANYRGSTTSGCGFLGSGMFSWGFGPYAILGLIIHIALIVLVVLGICAGDCFSFLIIRNIQILRALTISDYNNYFLSGFFQV